jgi:hypothetical protein
MIVNPDFVEGLDETDGAEQVTEVCRISAEIS